MSGSGEQSVHLILLKIKFLSYHSFLTSALLLCLHPTLGIWSTSQCCAALELLPVACSIHVHIWIYISIFCTFAFLFSVIYVFFAGRCEVEALHVEIRGSLSSSNIAIFSMVTLTQGPNICPASFASATMELIIQPGLRVSIGETVKNGNEGRNQYNLPQTLLGSPLYTQHLQNCSVAAIRGYG